MSKSILKYFLWTAYAYFSFLLLLITIQYIPYNTDVAFLRIKQDVIVLSYYKMAFFIHVYSSIFLMLFGFFQVSFSVNKKNRIWHKISGRLYAAIILILSGPSGLIMACHANGGLVAQTSFLILSLLWIFFTATAIFYALKRDFVSHKKFAIRSFALTLSAISLRLFKYIIVFFFQPQPMDVYRVVAWLGWTFNLMIAELYIFYKFSKKRLN